MLKVFLGHDVLREFKGVLYVRVIGIGVIYIPEEYPSLKSSAAAQLWPS